MVDKNNKLIEVGQKIKRVIEDGHGFVGREYEVVLRDFKGGTTNGEDLCAVGSDQTLLLYPERTKEFQIVQ